MVKTAKCHQMCTYGVGTGTATAAARINTPASDAGKLLIVTGSSLILQLASANAVPGA